MRLRRTDTMHWWTGMLPPPAGRGSAAVGALAQAAPCGGGRYPTLGPSPARPGAIGLVGVR
jgi:hypothetical protein